MSPVVIIILGTLLMSGIFWIRTIPAHRRGPAIFKLLTLLLVAIIVILTVTGRLHWIGALLAGFTLLYKKYSAGLKIATFMRKIFGNRDGGNQQHGSQKNHQLTRQDALKILGLEEGCTKEDIIQAHRKLMQKLHPDHGGNSYLAAQVNEARAFLLKKSS
jgi:DnaJ family protein C protein 19